MLTVFWVLPVGLLLLVAVLIYLIMWRHRKVKNVPHPRVFPIIGNGLLFINNTPSGIVDLIKDLLKQHGKRFQVLLGMDLVLFTADAKDFETILASKNLTSKSQEYQVLRNWLGDGLLLSSGRKWHMRRKIITPAFHFKILEQFTDIFHHQSDILVKQVLSKFAPHEPVNIYPLITLMALDVICETAMGAQVNAQINSQSDYVKAVKEVTHILHLRMFDLFLRWNNIYKFTGLAKRERKALKTLHSFTDSVIAPRRKELLSQQLKLPNVAAPDTANHSPDIEFGIKRKMNLMDLLLQTTYDGRPLTDREIREEVDTFMFEGHDTTTSAISFAMFMLAKNPHAQELAYQEVCQVIGKDEEVPASLHVLNELHYLELCIKETLRLFPSVPYFGRKVLEDVEINNMKVKRGTTILVGCHNLQRDPAYYEDPEMFKPERFLAERTIEINSPYTFVPFSAGPRNCIGQKFAMYEMKAAISKMLLHYEFTVDKNYEGPVLVAELILKPMNGVMLNLKRRTTTI